MKANKFTRYRIECKLGNKKNQSPVKKLPALSEKEFKAGIAKARKMMRKQTFVSVPVMVRNFAMSEGEI